MYRVYFNSNVPEGFDTARWTPLLSFWPVLLPAVPPANTSVTTEWHQDRHHPCSCRPSKRVCSSTARTRVRPAFGLHVARLRCEALPPAQPCHLLGFQMDVSTGGTSHRRQPRSRK